MYVSASENETVCYIVGNVITNAKVRGQVTASKKVRGPESPSPTLPPVPTPMVVRKRNLLIE